MAKDGQATLERTDPCFPLETFAAETGYTTAELKKIAHDCQERGEDAGIRKTGGVWVVDIPRFRRVYLDRQTDPHVRYVPSHWDGNQLLRESGVFHLRDVVVLLPFAARQMRYQWSIHENPREQTGIFKLPGHGNFLVDMDIFSRWITDLWDREGI